MKDKQIIEIIWKRLGFSWDYEMDVIHTKGVLASWDGETAVLGGETPVQIARAAMLFAKNRKAGKQRFREAETPAFDTCGCMLDMSRNAVMRPASVKEYLEYMAALGLNRLFLYTEDTYTLEKYPKFGYRRGRYSEAELKDMIDYAQELGIEAVPCIQTLGHMEQYLKWPEAAGVKDTPDVLLCDEEQTYQFIEEMIKTLRRVYSTDKIHIGMDEAHSVGLGNYLARHGYTERFSLLLRHLKRVCGICEKYGFHPMMWSDMFFRLGSPSGDYYDLDCTFTQTQKSLIPDVDLVYWDYYHVESGVYQKMMENHLQMGKKIIFAGGIWTWHGMLVNPEVTYRTMIPALDQCLRAGVRDVFAAMWGDDGAEVDYFSAIPLLAVFSEFCYHGPDCTRKRIDETGSFLWDGDMKVYNSLSLFHELPRLERGSIASRVMGKRIFYSDLFYDPVGCGEKELSLYQQRFEEGMRALEPVKEERDEYRYAYTLFEANALKCEILKKLRPAYQRGDKQALLGIYEDILRLRALSEAAGALHEARWRKHYKMFGWEVLQARYAMLKDRYAYVCRRILAYTQGSCDCIEEMDFDWIEETAYPNNCYRDMYR